MGDLSKKASVTEKDIEKNSELTLAELPVGTTATIVKVLPGTRGRKKFADVGLVAGTELLIEAHAPFGGLIRVKVMETSMALHRDDAANIVIQPEKESDK
ncbi:MAG: ferrous iron transport protein A [Lentisphaeria bacterium]|nr:ferrous iron transport protein A [Lentisphaeria bacterium]